VKAWASTALLFFAFAGVVAACSSNSTGSVGGVTSGAAASTSGAGGAGGASSGEGGSGENPLPCDEQGLACTSANNPSCQACALGRSCAPLKKACDANPECAALVKCFAACAPQDSGCFDGCGKAHPDGATDYNAVTSCVICDECLVTCDGASKGC
jgi:hypothetical protein